ncbi:MAG: DUF4251 domain-containing protein [Sphingobacteriaceae bacterium]|nr:MAG: DUF4251 domain-containing protein [Sphingobacteriaceae bacterium]
MLKPAFQVSKIILLATSFMFCLFSAEAQNTRAQKKQAKIAAIKKMVDNQNYVFMAQFANPLGWKTINLNYNYNVVISRDSVDSYLPYYGRAYVAPYNPTDPAQTGIQFKSKDFDYQENTDRKGNYEVTIVPHDVKETRKFFLNISDEGYATLSVTSNNRQSISFNGYVTENLPKTKK